MKNSYLKEIEALLRQYQIEEAEIKDIISDYDQMYEDGLAKEMTDAEIREFLGDPNQIVTELCENYARKQIRRKGHKLVALSPFVAVIIFFILGQFFDKWHPGWLVFLLIPVTAIIVETFAKKKRDLVIAISPFVAIVTYILIGILAGIWHPTWLVFLVIPISAIILGPGDRRPLRIITALSPFVALIIFMILGEFGYWHPGWLVFLSIPLIAILNTKSLTRILVYESAFLVAIGLYLLLGYTRDVWGLSLLVFLLPVAFMILFADYVFHFSWKSLEMLSVILVVTAIYILGGVFADAWDYLWLVFLVIPVYSILRFSRGKDSLVAISPFIAVTIFFVLGYFADLWTISWLAFLLIPITAILKNKS